MHWNEKVDLLQKKYSAAEFSIPGHSRKRLLRQVEQRYLQRPSDYFAINQSPAPQAFANWWPSVRADLTLPRCGPYADYLSLALRPGVAYWVVVDGAPVWLAKAQTPAIHDLLGMNQDAIFYLLPLHCDGLLGLNFCDPTGGVKAAGDPGLLQRLRDYTEAHSPDSISP
ncbi:MAG: hypothetical protein AAFW73_08300 [Bacteroidota bacterium]